MRGLELDGGQSAIQRVSEYQTYIGAPVLRALLEDWLAQLRRPAEMANSAMPGPSQWERFPHTLLSRVFELQHVYLATYTGSMAQVTVYLPEDVLAAARKCAKHERRSLSAWVSSRICESTLTEWPESLVDLLRHGTGDIVEPDDPPPGDLDLFL